METQSKRDGQPKLEAVEMTEMLHVSGGIWDYSNRLGILGQMLEERGGSRPTVSPPKNLEEAAGRALEGWVSIP